MLGLALVVLVLFVLTYKNTEIPKSECHTAMGIVSNIREGGVQDVVFELEGKQQQSYYINRGVYYGFDIPTLEKQLLAAEVTIYYADGWSLFDLLGSKCKHIREIRNGNWIIYSEF
ncbi:hypothetical protein [Flavobacterium sp.]|uniref:hypothetical protein n=1 Tax=Flavobacterium sp. TaxID=239 RepID=UPI0039E6A8EE